MKLFRFKPLNDLAYPFVGNGSDEAIDLLIRASCEPDKDRILSISPSYGMYKVCADIQGVSLDSVLLNEDFSLNVKKMTEAIKNQHKLIFLCSPNNPSGNLLQVEAVEEILRRFEGIVVVDEAYIDFANDKGLIGLLSTNRNLVLLRTFSKAWGLAGARCGMAIGNPELIASISKIKYPFNLNTLTQKVVLNKLRKQKHMFVQKEQIVQERDMLLEELQNITGIKTVFPSDANFILIRVTDPDKVYQLLLQEGIVVRNRNTHDLCAGCLRLSIGTKNENMMLLKSLHKILA